MRTPFVTAAVVILTMTPLSAQRAVVGPIGQFRTPVGPRLTLQADPTVPVTTRPDDPKCTGASCRVTFVTGPSVRPDLYFFSADPALRSPKLAVTLRSTAQSDRCDNGIGVGEMPLKNWTVSNLDEKNQKIDPGPGELAAGVWLLEFRELPRQPMRSQCFKIANSR
jgi:hypothetical protein